jgi:hypothetical protein
MVLCYAIIFAIFFAVLRENIMEDLNAGIQYLRFFQISVNTLL